MGQVIAKQLLEIDSHLAGSGSGMRLVLDVREDGVLIIGDSAVGDFHFVVIHINLDVVLAVIVGVVQFEIFFVRRDLCSRELVWVLSSDLIITNLEGSGSDNTEV
jgi:hypothetical protein